MNEEKMTDNDVAYVQAELYHFLEKNTTLSFLITLVMGSFLLVVGIGIIYSYFYVDMDFSLLGILFKLGTGVAVFGFGVLFLSGLKSTSDEEKALHKDLADQMKYTIEGVIQRKKESVSESGAAYYFFIDKKTYKVDLTYYTRFDMNQKVRLSISKSAKIVTHVELA